MWIPIIQDTFGAVLDNHDWTVDDPGTLYLDEDEYEDAQESPFDMQEMQSAANQALANYRAIFEHVNLLKADDSQR